MGVSIFGWSFDAKFENTRRLIENVVRVGTDVVLHMVGEARSPAKALGAEGTGVGLFARMKTGMLFESVLTIEGSCAVGLGAANLMAGTTKGAFV